MRNTEKYNLNAQAKTGGIYAAGLLGGLHDDLLIDTDGDSDLYVAELASRVAMQETEDEQSAVAFDWIN